MMDRLAVNGGSFRILELLDGLLCELRAVHFDRSFVELGGEFHRSVGLLLLTRSESSYTHYDVSIGPRANRFENKLPTFIKRRLSPAQPVCKTEAGSHSD